MENINNENLMLEIDIFKRDSIAQRLHDGGFNSIAKFELFIWDLEMFLQIQALLGEKMVLKGGAATQFYIPVSNQRTSIDIDMLCMASPDEVHKALKQIENRLDGKDEYLKFKLYKPKNPKVGLVRLETYFVTVPSICSSSELFASQGKQAVKVEFLYMDSSYPANHINAPNLFALETDRTFNILPLVNLFGDKLTTVGPNTIGIPKERADEQFKQLYDLITLFLFNKEYIISHSDMIAEEYEITAKMESHIHGIEYDKENLLKDMSSFIKQIQGIENNPILLQRANDFQALYLRRTVNRDKSEWAIVGFQLEMLIENIFHGNSRIFQINEIEVLIELLMFKQLSGPDKGNANRELRTALETAYGVGIEGLTENLFRKRIERIIWELVAKTEFEDLKITVSEIIKKYN